MVFDITQCSVDGRPGNVDEEQRFMYDCHPQPSHQLPFDQWVQIKIYSKFSGLCTRTDRSHLAVFCIDRNAIERFGEFEA